MYIPFLAQLGISAKLRVFLSLLIGVRFVCFQSGLRKGQQKWRRVLIHNRFWCQGSWSVPGELHNVNTLERFKTYDRPQLLQETAAVIWNDLLSGAAERDPSLLGRFAMISYADLKIFRMYYWYATPRGLSQRLVLGRDSGIFAVATCRSDLLVQLSCRSKCGNALMR